MPPHACIFARCAQGRAVSFVRVDIFCGRAPLGDTSTRQSRLGSSWSAGFGFETSRAAIIPRKAMGKWVRWVASQGVARWVTRWEAR